MCGAPGAVLNGTVNPQGSAGRVYFYWGTSPSNLNNTCDAGNGNQNYNTQSFTCGIGNLASNTTYYYEAAFYNYGNGSTIYGSVVKFTTLP